MGVESHAREPFRKIDSSASFGRHVLFCNGLRELRNGNCAIAAIRMVRFGGSPTAARVGFPWPQSRIVIA